jgi:hypothetical protein
MPRRSISRSNLRLASRSRSILYHSISSFEGRTNVVSMSRVLKGLG